jgi:hypothetical protein
MEKYEVGEEILLNSTTKNVPAKVLEIRPRGLLVFVPSTGQRLEIPYTVAVKQSR